MIEAIPQLDTPAQGVDFLAEVDREEDKLEAQLKALKTLRHELETVVLVELFDKYEQPEATSNSGAKAKRGMKTAGSLPKVGDKDTPEEARLHKRQREEAIAIAESYGWQPFIRTTVSAEYDKGDQEKARAAFRLLQQDNSAVVDMHEDINHMTLGAQARQRLREGKDVALDKLGLVILPAVLLTKRKDKR